MCGCTFDCKQANKQTKKTAQYLYIFFLTQLLDPDSAMGDEHGPIHSFPSFTQSDGISKKKRRMGDDENESNKNMRDNENNNDDNDEDNEKDEDRDDIGELPGVSEGVASLKKRVREWSARTAKTVHYLNNKNEKSFKFEDLMQGVSSRTVAGVFYELLVLKNHNLIELNQPQAYADITITVKKKQLNTIFFCACFFLFGYLLCVSCFFFLCEYGVEFQ